jgi:hypothetical protein
MREGIHSLGFTGKGNLPEAFFMTISQMEAELKNR